RQRRRPRAPKMGPDRIQRPSRVRRLVHEYPAREYGGVYRWEEYGEPGTGADTV
ncbi:MAG: hypothetical protein M1819_001506, partial [Sarea resinae]